MNKILLVFVAAMFLFACNTGNQSNDNEKASKDVSKNESSKSDKKLYSLKSGYMKYKMKMEGVTAVTIRSFKDYGKEEATYTVVDMMGQKMKNYTLRKDGYVYSYADGKAQGIKFKYENDSEDDSDGFNITEEMVIEQGGKKIGSETIAGKDCDIFEVPQEGNETKKTKVWVWKGMPLKMQNGDKVVLEALEAEETSDFPKGTFEVPDSINFVETPVNKPTKSDADFDEEGAKG